MQDRRREPLWQVMGALYKAHPWHGVPIGPDAPNQLTTYIEIVPTDTVKYEIDKITGHLKVDRPQKFSNICPTLYGFVPQTLCAERVGEYCAEKTGRMDIIGDGDPLDICVLTENLIPHGDIIVPAIPIGGLRMLDGNEADDKIIAVMRGDALYGGMRDISDCPRPMIDKLRHYFLTYKQVPGAETPITEITHVFGRDEAFEVIERSRADYDDRFRGLYELLTVAMGA